MKEINIPFNKIFNNALIMGIKICTTKNKKYGEIGDYFRLRGTDIYFKIINISRIKLEDIINNLYIEEGFNSKEDFKKFWLTIHNKLQLDKKYYLYTFIKKWLRKRNGL